MSLALRRSAIIIYSVLALGQRSAELPSGGGVAELGACACGEAMELVEEKEEEARRLRERYLQQLKEEASREHRLLTISTHTLYSQCRRPRQVRAPRWMKNVDFAYSFKLTSSTTCRWGGRGTGSWVRTRKPSPG